MNGLPDYLVINCTLPNGSIFQSKTMRMTNVFRNHLRVCAIVYSIAFFPIIIMNALVIISILKSRALRTKSNNIFVVSLSFSDFLMGLITMPISALYLYWQSNLMTNCYLAYVVYLSSAPLAIVSVGTVAGIAFERYLALFKPYTHERLMTPRRTVIFLLAMWAVVFLTFIAPFASGNIAVGRFIASPVFIGNFCWSVFVYLKIQVFVRRLKRRIQSENNPLGYIENSDRNAQEFSPKLSKFSRRSSPADHTNYRLFNDSPMESRVYLLSDMNFQASLKRTKSLSLQIPTSSDRRLNNLRPICQQKSSHASTAVSYSTSKIAFAENDGEQIKCAQMNHRILPPEHYASISSGSQGPSQDQGESMARESPQSLNFCPSQILVISSIGRSEGCCYSFRNRTQRALSSLVSCVSKKRIQKKAKNNDNGRLAAFTVSIIGAMLIAYLPYLVRQLLRGFPAADAITLNIYDDYAFTILALNSLLNPMIYFIQCPQIRGAMLGLVLCRPGRI